jgi:C-terminal processing protease CtpA/Prc
MRIRDLILFSLLALALAACGGQAAGSQFDPAEIQNDEGGPVTITGEVAYTYPFFTAGVAEPLVILEDQAGFVDRNRGYLMPRDSQTMGQITSDFFTSPFTYSISLPIEPEGGWRDVDQDDQEDEGVLVFAPAYWTNTYGDPFLEERDLAGGGWSTAYASTRLSEEAATEREYTGGKLLVYAADDQQGFPSGFGADAKLFTADDPIVGLPQGYTVVDMDSDPFTFDRSREASVDLIEPAGLALDDFSAMSYVEAFDAMLAMMSQEYSFTELKGIDWDALNEEFRPRFLEATDNNDSDAYAFALRDFLWSIPDGHIGFSFTDALNEQFNVEIAGGLGLAIRETDDGRVIVNFLTPGGPAEEAGIRLGAEVTELNGQPIEEAVSASIPWSSPFSTEHTLRLQQLRYAIRFPAGSAVEVTYQNPGGSAQTATLGTVPEYDSFSFSSFSTGLDGTELPVEFELLDSGFGYVAIYSFFDNELLTIQLWERMLQLMNDNQIPGLIVDLRNNGGGSGFLADQMAAYFFNEQLELGKGAAWDESIQDFYIDPNQKDVFYLPPEGLRYQGNVAVLVSPNCSSACEFFAYDMTLQDRAIIVGQYPTGGLAGSVKDFNMPDGITVRFPIGRPLDLDGNVIIEGVGIVPTVDVPVNEDTLLNGGDPVLDAAIVALGGTPTASTDIAEVQEPSGPPASAGVEPSGPPAMSTDFDFFGELNAGVPLLDDLTSEQYSDDQIYTPGILTYTVVMQQSTDVIAGYFWCTVTQEQLDDNWSKLELTFELDGQTYSEDDFSFESVQNGESPCNVLTVKLTNWPMGEHHFTVNANFNAAFNDGTSEYEAGTYRSEFTIYVEN